MSPLYPQKYSGLRKVCPVKIVRNHNGRTCLLLLTGGIYWAREYGIANGKQPG